MSEQDVEQLTLFREDSRANLFPWQETRKGKRTSVIYGLRCYELSENLRRVGSSVRTYLESCRLPLPTLSRIWSVSDITSSCLLMKLRLSEQGIGGSESFLWRTPDTADATDRTMRVNSRGEPMLSGQVKLFPTPTTGAGLCGGSGNYQQLKDLEQAGQITEEERRSMASGSGGSLNPTWVEWLMGFPIGWTDLNV